MRRGSDMATMTMSWQNTSSISTAPVMHFIASTLRTPSLSSVLPTPPAQVEGEHKALGYRASHQHPDRRQRGEVQAAGKQHRQGGKEEGVRTASGDAARCKSEGVWQGYR